jgi:hypothetical protein
MPKNHEFLINKVRWLWRYARLRGSADGYAFVKTPKTPSTPERILIDERLSGRKRLEIEIHEFLHAANPTHDEEHVTQQGRDLSRILWALGYRPKEGQ